MKIQKFDNSTADIHEFCGVNALEPVGEDFMIIITFNGAKNLHKDQYVAKDDEGNFHVWTQEFYDFYIYNVKECGMSITEDGAVHCCECGEPIYEEDFEGECPSCGLVICEGGEDAVTYDSRVEVVAGFWLCKFAGNMTKEDILEFHQDCKTWRVAPMDVLAEM